MAKIRCMRIEIMQEQSPQIAVHGEHVLPDVITATCNYYSLGLIRGKLEALLTEGEKAKFMELAQAIGSRVEREIGGITE